jgi:cell division septum initiation protein DivIVA
VVRQIRAREKAEQTRAEARSEADQLRVEARAEAAKILQEARDAAVRDAQAAREAFARDFREKPLSAIRGAGIDPGRLVSDVTAEGTPEFERQRAAEARILAAEARAQKAEDAAGGAHKAIEAQQEQIAAWHRQQAEREFVGLVPSTSALHRAADEASKALANIGVAQSREQILIQRAHAAADTIKAAGGVASPSNVVQYLEWEASQRLTPAQGAQATATEPTGRANGTTRTLSAAGASERRSAPKPMDELSPREQRALLVAEADAVLRGK